jgi:hypothetical protein
VPASKAPYHHGDLRNAPVDAGLGLIEQVGVEAFSLREVARFNAAARAYVHLAQEHPELFGLMFGAAGRACLAAEGALDGPSPGALLGGVLDELVEEKAISTKHRAGAEIRVWSTVHGFASLAQSGPLAALSPKARADALEALLVFVVAGLRGGLAP